MQLLWPWLLVAQASLLPQLAPGTEVRLVSLDLLEVYALGRVEDGRLDLVGEALPLGLQVRVLLFPPDADAADRAAALSGATALAARMDELGIVLTPPDAQEASLRELLARQGIEVRFPGEEGW